MFGNQVKFSFKRRFHLVVSIGFLLITSCGPKKPPVDVLSEQEMVQVLTEIYLAEEKAGNLGIPYDSIKKVFPKFDTKIFEKKGLSDSTFRKSMEYYKTRPKKLESIYAALIDSLSLEAQRTPPTLVK